MKENGMEDAWSSRLDRQVVGMESRRETSDNVLNAGWVSEYFEDVLGRAPLFHVS